MLLLMLTMMMSGCECKPDRAQPLTEMVSEPQQPSAEPTRAAELRIARELKAQDLRPPVRTFLENGLYEFKERRIMERFQAGLYGFHPVIGGMQTGSGFALGTSYSKDGFQASTQGSLNGYQKHELRFSVPRLLSDRVFADIHTTYRNYPQEDFFGTGSDSRAEDRANYRLEDISYGGEVGFRLKEHVKAGTHLRWIKTNVGAGTDARFPSITSVFDVTDLPGVDQQPSYLQTGAFLEVDYRDEPANPRAGGRYMAKWSSFQDRKVGLYDFSRYDIEVQQYIPFFNHRRVIALRGKTTLTRTAEGQEIPFFILPAMGGSEDLRGFTEFRFRDRNLLLLNAEYRWEAFSGLDLALFADAGQVAPRARQLDLGELKTAAGAGFRFNTAKNVFLRFDVGFSKEGSRVFMKFGHVF
jgi:outer membrane protein assembly factor BamA